jgi:hypothetical protein
MDIRIIAIVIFSVLFIICIIGLTKSIINYQNDKESVEARRLAEEQRMREKNKREQEAIELYDNTIASLDCSESEYCDEPDDSQKDEDWSIKIKQLKELLDIGAITEEEYKQEKEKHLK